MNKKEIDLVQFDLVLTYIKNKDYSTHYRRKIDNTVIDNEILNNLDDNLYITTYNECQKLQQENKQLKEKLSKYQFTIAKFKDLKTQINILNEKNFKYSFEEILKGE